MIEFRNQNTNSYISIYPLDILSVDKTADVDRTVLVVQNGFEIPIFGKYQEVVEVVWKAKREEAARIYDSYAKIKD